MTIFHVIKYPISTPPTLEQLQALPTNLLQSWSEIIGWPRSGSIVDKIQFWTHHRLSVDYQYMLSERIHHNQKAKKDLELLRKMISDYEESE